MPQPAGSGSGEAPVQELPLHELPLYVLEDPQPRKGRHHPLLTPAPVTWAAPPIKPTQRWAPAQSAPTQYLTASLRADVRFARLILLPFDTCTRAIDQWRLDCATNGVVEVGSSRVRDATDPRRPPGAYRLSVELRSGFPSRTLPMDMEVTPRYSYATMVVLLPRHRVLLLRRYFRSGHHLLDTVIDAIEARRGAVATQIHR